MAQYVYGIVRGRASRPAVKGIGGHRVRLVEGEGVAALVSELPDEDLRLGRDELMTHTQVLERAIARDTVLPMRFGVVLADDAEVRRRVLDDHEAELRDQLDALDGKVEVRIRAVYDERKLMRDVVTSDSEIARIRKALQGKPEDATYYDRIQLGELVAHAVERRREADERLILSALEPASEAVEISEPAHERMALNASFLVGRDRVGEFNRALDRLAEGEAGRLRFKYTGPLAPHSFVELSGVR